MSNRPSDPLVYFPLPVREELPKLTKETRNYFGAVVSAQNIATKALE